MRARRLLALAVMGLLVLGTARSAEPDIYPDPAHAKADVAAALKTAAATHRRVLLDANFVLVHVNIGMLDENLNLAKKYGVPIAKGVPALAVLSEDGTLLYSQKNGEFEAMRRMESSSVTGFLVQWRPARVGCSAVVVNC